MKRPREALRAAADAALQLALPLFGLAGRDDPLSTPLLPGRAVGHQVIEYELRRSKRRSIGFMIDGDGLRVTAPRHVTLTEVDAALAEKSRWVSRKLDEWRDHAHRREQMAIRWEFGGRLSYLGQPLTLVPGGLPDSGLPHTGLPHTVQRDGDRLMVGLAADAAGDALRETVHAWLKAQARATFAERLPPLVDRLGRGPTRWNLSSARTRWGSCAPDGSIRLNWRLIHLPLQVVDYVIAHELAHLVHLNHGPRFWAKVEALMPDYDQARRLLRDYPDDILTN
jgi:predicted metal-dependent hydrolase